MECIKASYSKFLKYFVRAGQKAECSAYLIHNNGKASLFFLCDTPLRVNENTRFIPQKVSVCFSSELKFKGKRFITN